MSLKISKSKEFESQVARARELRDQINAMTKELKPLIDQIEDRMGEDMSAKVGDYLLIICEKIRTDLDKKALAQKLGDELKDFEKKTAYTVLEIKKI
jgi:hypothetical protein